MNDIARESLEAFAKTLVAVRRVKPLVHHITNYVTVNDCANATLAIGASPIMADAAEEAGDIAAISSSVVLNIGTLNPRTIESAISAGRRANCLRKPVIFDPVGAGASKLRNDATARILGEVDVSVIRGNISEVGFILGLGTSARGVDASEGDRDADSGRVALECAAKLKCVVAVTGAVDAVSNGVRTVRIKNGHEAMAGVTGTGCVCSSLVGSFCGASPDALFESAVSAIASMGIAGEIAFERAGALGNGSFRVALIDAIGKLDEAAFMGRAKLYEA
ncbi:MAG: hydroxyethylthiazole kinase [Synergistaceae bacterium]|jgi:hydroxyethylthiazole kinase|nr:hydroxyethylthiazole kinase [Synergistaceae bacterium]